VLAVIAALAAALVALCVWIEHVAIAPEPVLSTRPSILDASVAQGVGIQRLGPAWFSKQGSIRVLRLQGSPFELGYENARLSGEALERLEDVLFRAREAFVPSAALRWTLRKLILFTQRDLPDHFSEQRKLEVLGLARGSRPDRHADEAPLYHRILGYHAIHDVGHLLIDSPFVQGHYDEMGPGCTAFAAVGSATADGHALLARNFDFEAGRIFDEEKVVLAVEPEGKIPFLSVAWSGMAGAVTGVNREGIACVLNAGASDDDATSGTPVSLVVREVFERARTLDEAIEIIRSAHVFVSDSFTLVSARENRAAVVERSPGRCAVREAKDGLVLAANHFLAPEFKDDAANARRRHDATTEERYARLEELVPPLAGKLSVPECVSVLRDRRGPEGADVGLGNRGAICALIATHSVVIDATARTIWVSEGPHTLGRYVPFALDALLAGDGPDAKAEARALPADPLLGDGGYDRHVDKRRALLAARAALSVEDYPKARAFAEKARLLDLRFYEAEELLARIADAEDKTDEARQHARAALDRAPPYASVRAELEALAR
jgi:hypothetical protein